MPYKGNCFSTGKIRLSERITSLLVIPSVRILSNGETGGDKGKPFRKWITRVTASPLEGETGEGKNINLKVQIRNTFKACLIHRSNYPMNEILLWMKLSYGWKSPMNNTG